MVLGVGERGVEAAHRLAQRLRQAPQLAVGQGQVPARYGLVGLQFQASAQLAHGFLVPACFHEQRSEAGASQGIIRPVESSVRGDSLTEAFFRLIEIAREHHRDAQRQEGAGTPDDTLKIIPLGGIGTVTKNMYIYEYGADILIVDCGIGFPEEEQLGVDLVIPDISYLRDKLSRIRGIVITHGHDDHYGGLPYLIDDLGSPQIFATKLVSGFIQNKLTEVNKWKGQSLKIIEPEKDTLQLGSFFITPFRVNHSVPDACGLSIKTPIGQIIHAPDFKFDWTPVDGKPFDVAKVATLASQNVLALASDALGANTPGYTESEQSIEGRIESITRDAKGKIYLTTISSNISRMQQTINVAQKLGRKVVLMGRSIERKAKIAKDLGYLFYPNDLVIKSKQALGLPPDKVLYIISGSYGQAGSALYRLCMGEHDFLTVGKGDIVIFSSDPAPPGSKANVDFLVDKLIEGDVDVHYYDMQEDLHVSGHGSIKDIEMLFALIKPKYYIPIGGTIRHMRAYSLIAQDMGAKESDVLGLAAGEIVDFSNQNARRAGRVPVKEILVDGLGIGDIGHVVLRDRQKMSEEGIVVVVVSVDQNSGKLTSEPDIISRGFIFEEFAKELIDEARVVLKENLEKHLHKSSDWRFIRKLIEDCLEKFFYQMTDPRDLSRG